MEKEALIKNFIGQVIDGNYKVTKHIGSGAIGHMFHCQSKELDDDRAVKLIPVASLREGWENEIIKVNKLKNHDKIVLI